MLTMTVVKVETLENVVVSVVIDDAVIVEMGSEVAL